MIVSGTTFPRVNRPLLVLYGTDAINFSYLYNCQIDKFMLIGEPKELAYRTRQISLNKFPNSHDLLVDFAFIF